MPKQKSVIKLSGTVDDMTYYQKGDNFFSRKKTSVNAERVANDPTFERTRENMAEFGRAVKATRTFRRSLSNLLKLASDGKMSLRLSKEMLRVVHSDPVSDRGKRVETLGDFNLLQHFECNNQASLADTFSGSFTSLIDRGRGTGTVVIGDFVPGTHVSIPDGATHFKFVTALSEPDFEAEKSVVDTHESELIAWDLKPQAPITLINQVTAASLQPLFLVVGMQFFLFVNGKSYAMKDKGFNPLTIVAVDAAV